MKKRKGPGELGVQMGLFMPESNWELTPLPDPSVFGADPIAIDTETRDPRLKSKGPGGLRGDGELVGISIASGEYKAYFPLRHGSGHNHNVPQVLAFFRDLLKRPEGTIVFANAPYDLEWLGTEGLEVSPRALVYDIQVTEPLIDEELPSYSLDALARRYGLHGKNEALLNEAAQSMNIDPKSEMWKLDPRFVGPYAEADAALTLRIWEKQQSEIVRQELTRVYEMESQLILPLWEMRRRGVRVDLTAADRLAHELATAELALRSEIREEYGMDIDEWSTKKLAEYCHDHGIQIEETEKGNPSLTSAFLASSEHPFLRAVHELRELNRLRKTFVEDWIFGNQVRGRIHPRWHQTSNDEGGARTGRMSASDPNPQQVPSKSKWAPRIRALFLPEEGKRWAKLDFSQQEPRLVSHFAKKRQIPGWETLAEAYLADKDIYETMAKAAGVSRREAKTITLGRIYGMGAAKLADQLDIDETKARDLLSAFDAGVPAIRKLAEEVTAIAERTGSVRTLWGRRRRFNTWEPAEQRGPVLPLRRAQAEHRWPNEPLRRYGTYKALNAVIQGSAADCTKLSILKNLRAGHGVPMLAVHDELNYSVDTEDQAHAIRHNMETAADLLIPMKAELKMGDSWQ